MLDTHSVTSIGPNGDAEKIVQPDGNNIHNWYQRNSITEPTVIEDCLGTVVGCPGGVSCGRLIPGITNEEVKWRRDWDGNRLRGATALVDASPDTVSISTLTRTATSGGRSSSRLWRMSKQ
jgi:hypothetical protein